MPDITKKSKLLDSEYLQSVKEVVDYIFINDEVPKAFELIKTFEKAMADFSVEVKSSRDVYNFYKKIINKLKFVALPLLDNSIIIDLLKNNFTLQFELPNYNLFDKFQKKLINIIVVNSRDIFKNEVKDALIKSSEKIASSMDIKTIGEWLRDYITKVGLEKIDNLAKIQYLTNLRSNKNLSEIDRQRLNLLFNFYERLQLLSATPQGFEEETPMKIDSKLFIFNHGKLEPVRELKNINRANETVVPPAPASASTSTTLIAPESASTINSNQSITTLPSDKILELQKLLAQYPPDSLERKAIEQELKSLAGQE